MNSVFMHPQLLAVAHVGGPTSEAAKHVVAALHGWPPFLITLILGAAALIVAAIFLAVILRMVPKRLHARHPALKTFLGNRRTKAILFTILAVFLLSGVMPVTPLSWAQISIVMRVITAILFSALGLAAITAVDVLSTHEISRYRNGIQSDATARKHATQWQVLRRVSDVIILLITLSAALMVFPSIRKFGFSLLASAGAAGLVVGLAARPLLSNIIAGIQIAISQPLRIEDVVIINDQWGWIEEITSTYVVVRIWNLQRMIVPLAWLIEKPFQNWSRDSSELIGTVHWHVDYTTPVDVLRTKLNEIVRSTPLWNGKVVVLQVTHAFAQTMELRALVSGIDSSQTWDLRCYVREKMIEFLQKEYPHALPRQRVELEVQNNLPAQPRPGESHPSTQA